MAPENEYDVEASLANSSTVWYVSAAGGLARLLVFRRLYTPHGEDGGGMDAALTDGVPGASCNG